MPMLERGNSPEYRKLKKSELSLILKLDISKEQVECFLGPLDEIVKSVQQGLAHQALSIWVEDRAIGFVVLHPDLRDNSLWWLGWWALDQPSQGQGWGRLAIVHILRKLWTIPGCSRIKLFVSAQNGPAIKLYSRNHFAIVGKNPITGELIMEYKCNRSKMVWLWLSKLAYLLGKPPQRAKNGRLRVTAGPHFARVIGVERGPPY